ncbi:prolyl aminopeptidase [Litoreibacter albidus]|uniref:Proline iminopeptidase n=1 Tax=Litoreibacter albidus TaxID=670155 RepID=A0A1H2WF94_9RHOB|nr:prolyl aminopeptidase [Litoreibacter albidus]SDW79353.1 proline iminopeptidase [Litoreibacter albidus]
MDRSSGQNRAVAHLYPPIDAFDQRILDVGDGHRVYVEQCGNPNGIPVVVLHGGPGGGCSPAMRRYFDPSVYRIVLFDQRGCGRSRPHASVENNTTQHLINDIELIRVDLGIEKWIIFGGSWGATLSLLYAQSHPTRAEHLVLRGVFLMTQAELDWFYGGGAGQFFPEQWALFSDLIPLAEQDDMIGAYHRRLFSGDTPQETRYARAWAGWENALAALRVNHPVGHAPADYARAFARLENHYFTHRGFLDSDDQIIANRKTIEHIPADIVQGRYDMICPPVSAYRLANGWRNANLRMIAASGHALSEPAITAELVRIMNNLRGQYA